MKINMDFNKFASEWISARNLHNLNIILNHYAYDVEINSPMIKIATGGTIDSLKRKEKVKD